MNEYVQRIDQMDQATANAIRENHSIELEIVETAIDQVIRGFYDFSSLKPRPDNRLESARLFLSTRSINSLRMALQSLERGYYQQAMTLVRMVYEDQLVAKDIEHHPPTLKALLEGEGKIGKGQFTFAEMAKRISPGAKAKWDDDYGKLSEYAAHTRLASLRGLNTISLDGQEILQPGSQYDKVRTMITLYYMTQAIDDVMGTVSITTYLVGSDWDSDAMPIYEKVKSLGTEIDEWAREYLEESSRLRKTGLRSGIKAALPA